MNRWKNLNSMEEIKRARDRLVLQAGSGRINPMEFDEKMDKLMMAEMRLRSMKHQKKHIRTSKYGKKFVAGKKAYSIEDLEKKMKLIEGVNFQEWDFKKMAGDKFVVSFNDQHFSRIPRLEKTFTDYEVAKRYLLKVLMKKGDFKRKGKMYRGPPGKYVWWAHIQRYNEKLRKTVGPMINNEGVLDVMIVGSMGQCPTGGKYFKIDGATYDDKTDTVSWEQDVSVHGMYGGEIEGSDEINIEAEDVIDWAKKIKKIRKIHGGKFIKIAGQKCPDCGKKTMGEITRTSSYVKFKCSSCGYKISFPMRSLR